MTTNKAEYGRLLLRKAVELRENVRQNIAANRFREDDIQMKRYNALIEQASSMFIDDPVLSGQLVIMPDGVLQMFSYPFGDPRTMPFDMPSKRLEEYLSILIDRLELVLGEPAESPTEAKPPTAVTTDSANADVNKILEKLDFLQQAQHQLPVPAVRSFDFIVDTALRQVLRLDYQETQMDFAVGSYKSSAILSGGLIEGMSIDVLRRTEVAALPKYQTATANFPKFKGTQTIDWSFVQLRSLIAAAVEFGILDQRIGGMAQGVRDFRNAVHPTAEVRDACRAGKAEARLLWAVVELTYERVDKYCRALIPSQP